MSQSAVRVATGLQQHLTKECLQKAAECFRLKPRHLLFYHPIKFEIRHTFPSSKLSLYSEEINGTTYWLGHLRNKLSKDTPIFTYEGTYNEADFLKAFEEFENIHDLFARSRLPLIVAEEKITTSIFSYLSRIDSEIDKRNYPCYLFYMTDEQMKNLIQKRLQLPEGYTIGTPNLEEEARCMTGTWRYGADGGLELTREKIRRFPSVCVRKDGRMVGFYMLEPLGWLNHHFVFEEHRGKGIGTLLELAHSQNCIRAGMRVCKLVELCNQTAIESTKRSKYWTLAKGDSGEELVIDYLDIYK
ncbi:hypothetical protein RB195_005138 [Necator americanus]|uniref:Glycine N-acyltransferase-like protein n=1 Tax=Necator americanus TaxID=51031 RepID=A0ABR1BLD3_NECAM